jgi:rhodanese-related sulfurtransferase
MILLTLLLAATITTKADVPRVQPAELHALMQKGEALAVDVRGTVPFEHGHIAGAVWMPLGLMNQRAGELPEDKLIVAYCTCKAEETSLEAAMMLSSLGFERVAVLEGGYPKWTEAGLPTESNRRGDRLAPPASVACDRNDLTVYSGTVKVYRRAKDKTVLVIDTTWGTTETATLRHTGTDDPSRFFLIEGTPFTSRDWSRIAAGMRANAWVCADGTVIVDWKPSAAE